MKSLWKIDCYNDDNKYAAKTNTFFEPTISMILVIK